MKNTTKKVPQKSYPCCRDTARAALKRLQPHSAVRWAVRRRPRSVYFMVVLLLVTRLLVTEGHKTQKYKKTPRGDAGHASVMDTRYVHAHAQLPSWCLCICMRHHGYGLPLLPLRRPLGLLGPPVRAPATGHASTAAAKGQAGRRRASGWLTPMSHRG